MSGRASKQKGSQAERDVARWLNQHGYPYAERSYGAGRPDDVGDIDGIPGLCIEVKNHKTLALAAWLNELEVEVENARASHGVLVVKRRGRADPGNWYAIMTLQNWTELAKEAGI